MEPSIPGLLLILALLALGRRLGSAVVIGLFMSLPFGSTALGTLGALGGSSPLVYVAFVLLLLVTVALSRGFADRLAYVLSSRGTSWVVGGLIVYAVAGAVLLPRLFLGQTEVFVVAPDAVISQPLAPVSANITQTGYFVLAALAYFAFAISLVGKGQLEAVRRGFLAWAIVHAGLGTIDLAGKLSGLGDALLPIRTATYSYLVDVEEAGFWRIAGGFSEASAFGSVTLACLAFSFAYWRVSRSTPVLVLALVLLSLLLLSTSSTAYAGLAIVVAFAAASMGVSALRGRLTRQDALVLAFVWLALIVVLSVYLLDDRIFDPVVHLLETVVLNKSASGSAQVRFHWNAQGLQSFLDTFGLGVGLGSSRAASWLVAVVSQLGVAGALLLAALVGVLLRDMAYPKPRHVDQQTLALVSGARAAALASLAAGSVSSGYADPGLIFFIALAVVCACRKGELAARASTGRPLRLTAPWPEGAGCAFAATLDWIILGGQDAESGRRRGGALLSVRTVPARVRRQHHEPGRGRYPRAHHR
jgi:hypothetical protein